MLKKEAPKQLAVEINGQSYPANPGEMVIQVADKNEIYIPRFCYHKKLSVAANCRMCLVEIEGARKPSPACATPVMDGMKVFTQSPTTRSYQKKVMEFLLINHPLDCPICDQGGECELQDIAMGYGSDVSQYSETKRAFDDPSLGSLIATDMTRCIQCTRCVRFGEEIAGDKELGAMGRGDHTQIGTYVAETVDSELSGNMIDLCPVGALTSKPFRFNARAWELQQRETISGADAVGANVYTHVRRNQLMRAVPKENEQINETWLADKDRFEYSGVNNKDRLKQPMIKKNDQWCDVSWEEALDFVKVSVEKTKQKDGVDAISAIASESSTTEELYLLQKIMRQIGSNNIETRLKQGSAIGALHAGIGFDCDLSTVEQSDTVLLIGSFLRKEIPLINHRVHKASKNGAKVLALNSQNYDFNYPVLTTRVEANHLVYALADLVKAVSKAMLTTSKSSDVRSAIEKIQALPEIEQMAQVLIEGSARTVILGFDAVFNQDFAEIYALFSELKQLLGAKGGVLSFGANSKGAIFSGACSAYLPGGKRNVEKGLSLSEILSDKTKLLLTVGVEPEYDCLAGSETIENLKAIDIVAVFSPFVTETMKSYADIILPITTHFETDGSFINITGQTQRFKAVIPPVAQSKPLWKVLRVFGNLLELDMFEFQTVNDVHVEIQSFNQERLEFSAGSYLQNGLPEFKQGYALLPVVSMYGISSVLRRSESLQSTKDHLYYQALRLSVEAAKRNGLLGENRAKVIIEDETHNLPLIVEQNLADNTLVIPFQLLSPCRKGLANVTITVVHDEMVDV